MCAPGWEGANNPSTSCASQSTAVEVVFSIFTFQPHWHCTEHPQVLDSEGSSYASDVYSFGIVVWEVMTRKLPWANTMHPSEIVLTVRKGIRPSFNEDAPADIIDIAKACWCGKPKERTTFRAVLEGMKARAGAISIRSTAMPWAQQPCCICRPSSQPCCVVFHQVGLCCCTRAIILLMGEVEGHYMHTKMDRTPGRDSRKVKACRECREDVLVPRTSDRPTTRVLNFLTVLLASRR